MPLLEITPQSLLHSFMQDFQVESLRYLILPGTAFLIFYVLGRQKFFRLKIQPKFPEHKHIWREVKYSALSLVIFALFGVLVYCLHHEGLTRLYFKFSDHSIGYFIFSVAAMIVMHDTWFYWTHRLLHLKKIYPVVHKIHHLSHDPTPWAAYAFHPVEAVVQATIFPIMVCLLPLHPLAIVAWGLYQATLNTMGHSGFELFPSGFTSHIIAKWHNTSTHHNMHHKFANSNYGLYFNFWDRIMGTNHPKYTEYFEEIKTRSVSIKVTNEKGKSRQPSAEEVIV
jgi:sterol desaturase/sphingolipid hydroxylase (fatty acid hydroxylase superfamily)